MIPLAITITTWIVWAIIGIIAGYMTGRLIGRARLTPLYVIIGIIGAILGGWAFVTLIGDSEDQQIISLLTSLLISGIFLWITTAITGKRHPDDN